MTISERFLRAKHWQLFLLTFGIPMIFQFIMMGTMAASLALGTDPNPSTFFNLFAVFPILMAIFVGTFFGWFWSIAIGLQDKIPMNIKMKTGKFKVFFFIPIIYILLFSISIGAVFSELSGTIEGGEQP